MGFNRQVFFILIFLVFLGGLSACRKASSSEENASSSQTLLDVPELKMERVHVQLYGDDSLQWEMTSPHAEGSTTKNIIRGENLELTLYRRGNPSTLLRGDQGTILTDNPTAVISPEPELMVDGMPLRRGDMYLKGNVVVTSTDGAKLETEWLWFQRTKDVITSSAPVVVTRQDSITKGIGLEAKPDLSVVRIFKQTVVYHDTEEETDKKSSQNEN